MEAKDVSIYSDGWVDAQRIPIINSMVVTESGLMFLNSVNAEEEVKKTGITLRGNLKIASERLGLKMLSKS